MIKKYMVLFALGLVSLGAKEVCCNKEARTTVFENDDGTPVLGDSELFFVFGEQSSVFGSCESVCHSNSHQSR